MSEPATRTLGRQAVTGPSAEMTEPVMIPDPQAPLPATWPQLRAAEGAARSELLRELDRACAATRDLANPAADWLAGTLIAPLHGLSRLFAVGGGDKARARVHSIVDVLLRLSGAAETWVDSDPAAAVRAAHAVTLLRCLDVALPTRAIGADARWLRRVSHPRPILCESMRRTAALNALVVGDLDLVAGLIPGGRLRHRARPRPVHGPNMSGFIRLLAEATPGSRDRAVVDESWQSFLRWFPLRLASDGATWVDLVLAAAVIAVRFDQRPIASVAGWLPPLIAGLD